MSHVTLAALLWAVTAWRAPSLRHSPKQRALAAAFAALAIAMTAEIPRVSDAVDHLTGKPGTAYLIKHLTGAIAASAVLDFVTAVTRPAGTLRKTRRVTRYVAWTAMVLTFLLAPGADARQEYLEGNDQSAFAVAHVAIFTLYILVSMAVATVLFLYAGAKSPRGWTRAGMVLLGAGCAIGIAYSVERLYYITLAALHPMSDSSRQFHTGLSDDLKFVAIVVIAAGSCLPPISIAVEGARAWKNWRALAPGWAALTSAVPHVRLDESPPRYHITHRLRRRQGEFEDAILAVRAYCPPMVQQVAAATLPEPVLADAAWLLVAAQRAQEPGAVTAPAPHPSLAIPADELTVHHLCRLSHALADPRARDFAAALS
ncbi:MAB_1171c family putative transporter [Streptomyces sp. GZWMJZ-114]|uniref:MAB_1171c family putative transporter n=1 Tax=Streptomyces sp. GZWMJZ-114 TaxID=2494734 RepID=UPI0010106693|nr:MAB_1171c family putative transporter [Streptomyces sp. GZWMJZ-114]